MLSMTHPLRLDLPDMTTTKDHLESALMEAESREKKDKARLKELDRTLTDFSSDNKSAQVGGGVVLLG